MRTIRTDLAVERHAGLAETELEGVALERKTWDGAALVKITVNTEAAARRLQKPRGVYYTAELEGFPTADRLTEGPLYALREALDSLLPPRGGVLVAGLGNLNVTPDALGPRCAQAVLATRHIGGELRRRLELPELREVSVIAPGVTGQTGMEAAELIAALCGKIKPAAVVAVDALAAADASRLAKTVQLSSAGIEPGSGVGNARRALNETTLGVPVIAVGVPTVVDAVSLLGGEPDEAAVEAVAGMMVTPREIDTVIDGAARLVALALNCVLQKKLGPEALLGLT